MKKLLFALFVIGAVFTSCGSDDEPVIVEDLTMKDNTQLIAQYSGTCTINTMDIKKDPKTPATNVELKTTANANILYFISDEFGMVDSGDKLRGFKYTSTDKAAATFSMGAFVLKRTEEGIPTYITDWFASDFDDATIKEMEGSFSETSAIYTIATQTLTFTYTGIVTLKGNVNGEAVSHKHTLKYEYSVIQKK